MASPPLYGLVLAGGASRRMQADKAALAYGGKPQLEHAYELVSSVCEKSFVSARPDQRDDPLRGRFPVIADLRPGIGPIAGIEAAQSHQPDAAWLVLACDLPFLDEATLEHLIRHRDPGRMATAYRSTHDSLPEPLCTIWEPASKPSVTAWIDGGKQCPRKLLINSDIKLIEQRDPRALDNVNTPEELLAARAALGEAPKTMTEDSGPDSAASPKTLRVQYFALFREQAGRGEETVESSANTPAALYRELQQRHPFKLAKEQLRVAINAEFCDWQTPLKGGDTVVFIPPVAGG